MENYIQVVGLSALGIMALADAVAILAVRHSLRHLGDAVRVMVTRKEINRGLDVVRLDDRLYVYLESVAGISAFHSYHPSPGEVVVTAVSGKVAMTDSRCSFSIIARVFTALLFVSLAALFLDFSLQKIAAIIIPSVISGLFFWATLFSVKYYGWQEAVSAPPRG